MLEVKGSQSKPRASEVTYQSLTRVQERANIGDVIEWKGSGVELFYAAHNHETQGETLGNPYLNAVLSLKNLEGYKFFFFHSILTILFCIVFLGTRFTSFDVLWSIGWAD